MILKYLRTLNINDCSTVLRVGEVEVMRDEAEAVMTLGN